MTIRLSSEVIIPIALVILNTMIGVLAGLDIANYYYSLQTMVPKPPQTVIDLFVQWPTYGLTLLSWNIIVLIITISIITRKTWAFWASGLINVVNFGVIIAYFFLVRFTAQLYTGLFIVQIIIIFIAATYIFTHKDWIIESRET
jgi:hypothetical protein